MMRDKNIVAVPDVHHVAILHDVLFAFQAQPAFRLSVRFRTRFQKLVPVDGLSADEVFF